LKPVDDLKHYDDKFFEFSLEFDDNWSFYNNDGLILISENGKLLYQYDIRYEGMSSKPKMHGYETQDHLYVKSFNLERFSDQEFLENILKDVFMIGYDGDIN